MPIAKLFLEENNFGNFELLLLHSIYSLVIALVDIPSGYLADVWGRKNTLLSGLTIGFFGFLIYSVSYSLTGFLLAEIALGLGLGFISGADSALLYDSLKQENKKTLYLKTESRITAVGNLAEGLAGLAVTILAFSIMRNYYWLQTAFSLVALITAFFIIEPSVNIQNKSMGWKSIGQIVNDSLVKNKMLSRYIFFSAIIGVASLAIVRLVLIFLYDAGIQDSKSGIYWSAFNIMVAIGSFFAYRVYHLLGVRNSLLFILCFLSGGYFIAAQFISSIGILFLMLFYFVRGIAHPILKERINHYTSSDVRATVLSLRSLLIRVQYAIIGPILGMVVKKISLSVALMMCGTIIFVPGSIFLYALLCKKTDKH